MKFSPIFLISIAIVLIATLTPGNGKIAGNYLDKVAHFLMFAFMTYQALKSVINEYKIPDVIIWCVLLGFTTEFFQQFIPGRGMDIYDAIADTFGVASAYYYFRKKVN